MTFHVITLFPELVEQCCNSSIIGRAFGNGVINLELINLRDFAINSYGSVDDYTYGGGAGMLIACEPVYNAYQKIMEKLPGGSSVRTIYTTPQARVFTQTDAKELSRENDDIIFICGHYEGIDERVLQKIVTDYYSIGDYVLTGGELPVAVIIDAVARLIPGVLNNDESAETESFNDGLLEYPQYTRPKVWQEMEVPPVLLSGDHKKVGEWRHFMAKERTKERRPELYTKYLEERGIW
ncbi:MAG: tRNA (guanosine(37)-N1)-methyltransferase TrmD [Lachnospiraceae bacterium]|nr:tRNA (guanosine(37)-N1)-methyltransferase TrmD [Lachnospiraceae bacterium]